MPLSGQAKTDYQREYMRKRRSNKNGVRPLESVRPNVTADVRPNEYDKALTKIAKTFCDAPTSKLPSKPEPQSHNSMMVGYVPPTE